MEVNPDTPDPVQVEIDPANEIGYIAEDILQDTVLENPEVIDEVQDHINDTQANVFEENMHGDRNPENILPDSEVETDGNRVVRRRQPPQRFTYYGPGNPAYINPVYGEKSSSVYQSTTITQTNLSIYLTLHLLYFTGTLQSVAKPAVMQVMQVMQCMTKNFPKNV